jgi:hypothetical protein
MCTRHNRKGFILKNSFKPREVALLADVVDRACAEIGGCDEDTKSLIAMRVLALAERGERDFDVLLSSVILQRTEYANGR